MKNINRVLGLCLLLGSLSACITVNRVDDTGHASQNSYSESRSRASAVTQDLNEWAAVRDKSDGTEYKSENKHKAPDAAVETEHHQSVDALHIGKIHLQKKGFQSVKSLSEKNIFMQKHDYSCGAASLATLMHFYFGDDVSERSLLDYIKRFYTQEEYARIENDGLSFLELEQISRSLGYQTASVRLKMAALEKLKGPVIVFVARDDYRHFAVLKGIFEDRVFIADPSRGNIRMSRDEFAREWDGRTFILGKKDFADPDQHAMQVDEMTPLRKELVMLRTLLSKQQPLVELPDVVNRYSHLLPDGG